MLGCCIVIHLTILRYDEGDETSYYDDLKAQMSEQAQLNQAEFQDLDDETRAHYEGFRPGVYVRVEVRWSFTVAIDRMHKWRPKMYSFVYVLMRLTSLALE